MGLGNSKPLKTPKRPPGPPRHVFAVAGAGCATLYFHVPRDTGTKNASINFMITSNPPAPIVTALTSPVVIPNLKNGTAYTFTVCARNEFAYGPRVWEQRPVTPRAPPTPPRNVTMERTGSGSVRFSFDPPSEDGGSAVLGYQVTAELGRMHGMSDTSPIKLDRLINGVNYLFALTARNAVGDSEAVTLKFTPAIVPGPPCYAGGTPRNNAVAIRFLPNISDGGMPVLRYRITAWTAGCSADGALLVRAAIIHVHSDASGREVVVTGLLNGVAYTFTAAAINEVGSGEESEHSPTFIPRNPVSFEHISVVADPEEHSTRAQPEQARKNENTGNK
jgi:hypothetical protein